MHAHQHRQRVHVADVRDQTEGQCAEGAEDQTEEDETSASKAVGQRAAHHPADQTEEREHAEDDARLGHADFELLRDVECEEREEHGPADAVDKADTDHDPEQARIIVIDLFINSLCRYHYCTYYFIS